MGIKKTLNKLRKNELAIASILVISGQTLTNLLNYLYNVVVGKILSGQNFDTSAYGEFWALSSLSYYLFVPITALTLVATTQISGWLAQDQKSKIKHYVGYLNKRILWITLILSLLSILLTPILKSFLHISSSLSIIILNLSIISTLLYSVNSGALLGLRRFYLSTFLVVIPVISKLIFGGIFTYFYGVTGAISGNLFQSFFIAVLSFVFVRKALSKFEEASKPTTSIEFPWKLFMGSIVATLSLSSFLSTDVILVKHFLSSEYLGDVAVPSIYSMLSLFGRIIYFLGISLSSLVIPFANFSKEEEKKISITVYSMLLGLLMVVPVIGIYFLFPEFLIKLIFSEDFLVGAKYLGPYAFATSFYALSSIMINHFVSKSNYSFAKIPLFFSILQIALIILYNQTIEQFIWILFIINFLCFVGMLWYNYTTYHRKNHVN